MTNEEIIQRGILIRDETEPAQNTSERVGSGIEGIGRNLADKDTAIAAEAARNGYYQCTVSGTTLAVTAPGFTLPAHGGNIRIKMSAPATGASTLNINGTGPKALLYNGAAVSSANTWEKDEIISVFYDPSGSGQYLASNSQGGGGKAEKIKFDNSQSGLASQNVQGALDKTNKKVDKVYYVENIVNSTYWNYTLPGFVNNDGEFVNVTGSLSSKYKHTAIKIPSDITSITIKANETNAAHICFVSEYVMPTVNNQEVIFCEEYPNRIQIQTGGSISFDVYQDCAYVVIGLKGNDINFAPNEVLFNYAKHKDIDDSHVIYKEFFRRSQYQWIAGQPGLVAGTALIYRSDSHHKVIERDSAAKHLKVVASPSSITHVAFVKDYTIPTTGQVLLLDLCDNQAATNVINAGKTKLFEVPYDCKFIIFNNNIGSGSNYNPSMLYWGYDDVTTNENNTWLSNIIADYKNTSLTIIGDSISTYEGMVETGYASQYGKDYIKSNVNYGKFLGVLYPEQTWWKRFTDLIGFELKNLSWSGSGVTPLNSAPTVYRRATMIDSNCSFVIIALGANDASNGVTISPSENWDMYWDMKIEDLNGRDFFQGLVKGIKQIQSTNPYAKIMLFDTCHPTWSSHALYREAEVAIAEHYGLLYLNMVALYKPEKGSGATFNIYNFPNDYHPNVVQMGFIYNGLVDYLKAVDLRYDRHELKTFFSDNVKNNFSLPSNFTDVIATYDNVIVKYYIDNNNAYLLFSNNLGCSWSEPILYTGGIIVHTHIFSDGSVLLCDYNGAYYVDNDYTQISQTTIYDIDGSEYSESDRKGFYSEMYRDRYFYHNGIEMEVFGEYITEDEQHPLSSLHARIWYSIDNGRTLKCAFESGVTRIDGQLITIRHIHYVGYCDSNNKFYISTGDSPSACYLLEGDYDVQNDTWSYRIIGQGDVFKFGIHWYDDTYAYFITDYTVDTDYAKKGILRCKISALNNSISSENIFKVFNHLYLAMGDEWYNIAITNIFIDERNGYKILFPDFSGVGYLWISTQGYKFKKVNLDKQWLIGFDTIGPNLNGDFYVVASRTNISAQIRAHYIDLVQFMRDNGLFDFMS